MGLRALTQNWRSWGGIEASGIKAGSIGVGSNPTSGLTMLGVKGNTTWPWSTLDLLYLENGWGERVLEANNFGGNSIIVGDILGSAGEAPIYLGGTDHYIKSKNGDGVFIGTNGHGLRVGEFSGSGSSAPVYLGDSNHYIKSSFGKGVSIGTYGATDAIFLREGSGKVGIGVGLNHAFGEGKLEVNGTVRAKKFVAELSGWPDYVFAPNYELMPLSDIQAFINSNCHLPGIPSAEEIETNGIDLAALAKLQMQKIEELTLYLIEVENRLSKCELK